MINYHNEPEPVLTIRSLVPDNANATQVAGEHYQTEFQHWDLVATTGAGYFEGQVSKYITRHAKKNGKQDALKALHFARKLYELASAEKVNPSQHLIENEIVLFDDFAYLNKLTPLEGVIVRNVIQWYSLKDLNKVIQNIRRLIDTVYPEEPAEAGAGYVNQDR